MTCWKRKKSTNCSLCQCILRNMHSYLEVHLIVQTSVDLPTAVLWAWKSEKETKKNFIWSIRQVSRSLLEGSDKTFLRIRLLTFISNADFAFPRVESTRPSSFTSPCHGKSLQPDSVVWLQLILKAVVFPAMWLQNFVRLEGLQLWEPPPPSPPPPPWWWLWRSRLKRHPPLRLGPQSGSCGRSCWSRSRSLQTIQSCPLQQHGQGDGSMPWLRDDTADWLKDSRKHGFTTTSNIGILSPFSTMSF